MAIVTAQILDISSYSENFIEIELKILEFWSFIDFQHFLKTRKCGVWVVSPQRVTYMFIKCSLQLVCRFIDNITYRNVVYIIYGRLRLTTGMYWAPNNTHWVKML